MKNFAVTVKEFNANQDSEYEKYVSTCKMNGVEPAAQSRYYPKVDLKYGYVYQNAAGEIYHKKRKKDFNV
jgi:hypothetical protein